MELKDRLIGQEVRRVVISLKKESCGYLHVFSIFEQIDKDMQDYEDFAPNNGNEFNDFDRTAKGKEDKLFLTVDRITITEDLYEQPWKDYYSGKDLLQTTTDEYQWPLGKEDWGVIPSDDNNNVELKTLLPRRYCPRFVRYCLPKKQTEALSNILKNEKLRVQLKELTIRNLGYDLTEHSLYLGGFIFLASNDIYSNIDFTEKGTQDGIFCRISYKNDNRQPLKVVCRRKGNDGSVIDETNHILDGSRNLYELDFGKTFHTLEVNIFDQNGSLLDLFNNLVFIHSIHFDMRVGDSEVHVNDEEGNTIKTVQKYIEGPRTVIGDKNPIGLLDSSPEYAYRKFEEALDFVFYDGDKEQSEENIRRAEKDILRIIDSAKDRVYICDVFFDVKSLARFVLPMACRSVPVKILSGKKELKQDGKREKLASAIKEFNEKGIAKVECRLLIGKKAELHDRFIVADDNVWMLGCSLNEFGNRATTLIRVPKDYKQKLIDRALEWWNDETLTVDIYMMLKKRLTLNGNNSSVNGSTNFVDGKYYHFYDRMLVADEDVPGLYQQLLASAKQTIAIWDPYYYKNCNGIFGDIQQDNIYIEILTICQGLDMKPDINDFANKVMKSIDKKKVPHCKVRVYAFSPSNTKMYPWKKWHDRFLIIDNARVYLVGSSMDSQVLADNGKNTSYGFGIMEVTEHDDLDLIKKSYERFRNALKDGPDGNGFNCFVHRP